MQKYHIEFVLHTYSASEEKIKSSLSEFAEKIEVEGVSEENTNKGREFKVAMVTDEPEAIFDLCGQFGRIKSVKINEVTQR